MKQAVWMSFDLGVRGDYEGLYAWLDSKKAIECGDSLSFFKYDVSDNIVESLEKEIKENVEINKKTRIYVIFRDAKKNQGKGLFLEAERPRLGLGTQGVRSRLKKRSYS